MTPTVIRLDVTTKGRVAMVITIVGSHALIVKGQVYRTNVDTGRTTLVYESSFSDETSAIHWFDNLNMGV